MARRRTSNSSPNSLNDFTEPSSRNPIGIKLAIWAAIFILGVGLGASLTTLNPTARTIDALTLDVNAPSRDFCNSYGASALVTTNRIFVTLNPFSIYVSQSDAVPGCVVLPNNWNLLLQKNAISDNDIRACRDRMNTFGYTGDLDKNPRVDCVYETKDAQQKLLTPKTPPNPSS
ncbi:MAG: DUF3172 domain-containing protein [Pseudanabaenaceae cyanobacterium bins.68]|nr:DUF3172 domain-containing protein [Pseudanabaenaceae cyanobacterium bins.68]